MAKKKVNKSNKVKTLTISSSNLIFIGVAVLVTIVLAFLIFEFVGIC